MQASNTTVWHWRQEVGRCRQFNRKLSLNYRFIVIQNDRALLPGFAGQLTEQEALAAYTIKLRNN